MAKKQPPFKPESEEAKWWAKNQDFIANRLKQAKAAGKLPRNYCREVRVNLLWHEGLAEQCPVLRRGGRVEDRSVAVAAQ